MFAYLPTANDFTITLLSNNSSDKFIDNVQSSFTNYLETALILNPGEWSVGITEVFHNAITPTVVREERQIEHTDAGSLIITTAVLQKEDKLPSHDFLYISCDIIEDRIIGDQRVKCLKVLPTLTGLEQMVRFGRVEYYRVGVSHIRGISIIIADQEGKLINFNKSFLPTMITLHFRRHVKSI